MIIYYLHDNPAINAQMLDDKSLDKQIKAVAQVLCNVHLYTASDDLYYGARDNVPLELDINDKIMEYTEWARTCLANYKQLVEMGLACCYEYQNRFNCDAFLIEGADCEHEDNECENLEFKCHKLQSVIEWAQSNQPDLPARKTKEYSIGFYRVRDHTPIRSTPFPLVMPEKYKINRVIMMGMNPPDFETKHIIESYRNYYRAKYEKSLKGSQSVSMSGVPYYSEGKSNFKWSRREKPEFLEEA
jgi:hypothetical protein